MRDVCVSIHWTLILALSALGCGEEQASNTPIHIKEGIFVGDVPLYQDAAAGGSDSAAGDTSTIDVGKGPDDGSCGGPCDDSLPCTLDSCQAGSCTHALQPGFCLSSGACVAAGPVAGNPCLTCDPAVATLSLQPNVGAACDDGVQCTEGDACDAQGSCTGKPAQGCCKTDLDCASGAPCLAALCDVSTGACKTEPKQNCCEQGVCCNPSTFSPHLAGTPCGTTPLEVEWGCDGAQVRRREGVAACDGASASTCGQGTTGLAWGDWKTTSTCPQGKQCVLTDKAKQPQCGDAPDCTTDAQCNDGKVCTQDVCKDGSCQHPPVAAGVPCGSKPLKSEYKCSSPNKGAAIQVRHAVSTCDGLADTCPPSSPNPVWGPWQTLKFCGFNELCEVKDATQPGSCVGAPQCQPSSTCCDGQGQFAAKGTACGDKVVKTEAKCEGAKGGKLLVREAKGGCSGSSTSCYSYVTSYLAWSEWKLSKQCGLKETCEVSFNGETGSCTTKTQCTPGSSCCDKDGFYAAKGTQCGATPWKTEQQCSGTGKGAAIQERKGWRGCTGTSTSCSSLSAHLVWEPWKDVKTCPATALCEVSFGSAKCVTQCSSGQACCTASGEFAAKGTKCGSWSVKSESKCDGAGKGVDILKREAFYGCSGSSGSCSYDASHYHWGAWTKASTCAKHQSCEVKYGNPTCTSVCDPTSACCTDLGEYAAKGTKCGTTVSSTETKCSGTELGGAVMERKAYRGCSGADGFCSYLSSNYVWGPWAVKTQCSATQVCSGSFGHYCTTP